MTVKELIKELKKLPQELPVILQQDPEGNGYHQCGGAGLENVEDPEAYRPEPLCVGDDDHAEFLGNVVVIYP